MRALQDRGAIEPEMAEQVDERLQPLGPIGLDIEPLVIEKSGPGAQAGAPFSHVARYDVGCSVTRIAKRAGQIAARMIENVAAAPVDEFQHSKHGEADTKAVFDRLVDILGAR